MSQSLAKYHARNPRYILQPQDNTLIRIGGPKLAPWEEGTEIKNISLSGLAFTADTELCPIVGEVIKIEFEVPGSKRMACYGIVTRLEPAGSTEMMVGIQFVKLDMPHRVALLQGLAHKLREQQRDAARKERLQVTNAIRLNWPLAIVLMGIFCSWLVAFQFTLQNAGLHWLVTWLSKFLQH